MPAPETTSRWTRRLRCPHCQAEFDYDLIPGASLTAVRLGSSRYMRCPMCHRFGLFSLRRRPGTSVGSARPGFSDRRTFLRWGLVLLVPALVLLFSGAFFSVSSEFRVGLVAGGGTVLLLGTLFLMLYALPERTR